MLFPWYELGSISRFDGVSGVPAMAPFAVLNEFDDHK